MIVVLCNDIVKPNPFLADVNECGQVNTCGSSTVCTNTPGSYHCDCFPGYQLDPTNQRCTEINECAGDNACDQVCVDGVASYTCNCTAGFRLSNTDYTSCIRKYSTILRSGA